jgi:hypothetical protein
LVSWNFCLGFHIWTFVYLIPSSRTCNWHFWINCLSLVSLSLINLLFWLFHRRLILVSKNWSMKIILPLFFAIFTINRWGLSSCLNDTWIWINQIHIPYTFHEKLKKIVIFNEWTNELMVF